MPKQPAQPAALPGDIIQVSDPASPLYLALLVVQDVRRQFTAAGFPVRGTSDGIVHEYARLRPNQYVVVGTAALVDGEIGKARRAAVDTARLLAGDKQKGGTRQ